MAEIDEASHLVRRLVSRETETMGLAPAMTAVGRSVGVGRWTIWGLYHRRRKTIGAGQLGRLRQAYLAWCRREIEKLEAELRQQQKKSGDVHPIDLMAEVQDLAARIRKASDH